MLNLQKNDYRQGGITLLFGDCVCRMQEIEDETIALLVADPPYCSGGMSLTERKKKTAEKYQTSGVMKRLNDYNGDARDQRAAQYFNFVWLSEAFRAAKPGASALVFTDWRQIAMTIDSVQAGGWIYRGLLVWDKMNARPQPNRFKAQCEYIVWGTKGDAPDTTPSPDAKYLDGVFREYAPQASERIHMNQKPIKLIKRIMEIEDEGIVLDPFSGSGTTACACIETKRDFIGIEADKQIFDASIERIKRTQAQGTLF